MTAYLCVESSNLNHRMQANLGLLLGRLVDAGIHPSDRTGIAPVPVLKNMEKALTFAWQQLFEKKNARGWCWKALPSYERQPACGRQEISRDLGKRLVESVFGKAYFALEESGWGYPCLPITGNDSREHLAIYDAITCVGGRVPGYSFCNTKPETP